MSFATKYRSEFKDRLGLLWRIDIEEDGFAGSVTNLKATGTPLNFDFLSGSDNIFENPIHGSTAEIGIYSETDFAWTSLYNYGNLVYRVSIYYSASYTLYWRGFINSDGYEEPYDGVAYPVSLSASDGLGMLKDMLYKYQTTDPDDTYYNGRTLASQVIIDILTKINITGFTEFVNIYDAGMNDAVTDSPFDQYKIDVDVFRDMYCYEVLEQILKKYNACIRQVAGAMVIYRPADLSEATIYGRIFTTASAHTGTSMAPHQYIDRKTSITDHRAPDGGTMMVQPPAKKVTIRQDYGYKESWIDNNSFNADTFDGTNFDGWIKSGTITLFPLSSVLPSERFGCGSKSSDQFAYIYQNFGQFAKSTTDVFILEFDWLTYNYLEGLTVGVGVIYFENQFGTYYLYEIDSEYCGWTATPSHIHIEATPIVLPVGGSEWKHWSRKIVGIPTNGNYTIKLQQVIALAAEYVFWSAKDIRFYCTSDNIVKNKKKKKNKFKTFLRSLFRGTATAEATTYTYTDEVEVVDSEYVVNNTIKGIDIESGYILGDVPNTSTPVSEFDTNIDNVLEQFAGALSLYGIMDLTDAAAAFVVNHAIDYSPGGVTVTSSTNHVILTAAVPGTDFTGSTTITNVSGDLGGTVANTQANFVGQSEIDRITITGTSGTSTIICNGVNKTITWDTNVGTTIDNFIAAYAADFLAAGVTLVDGGTYIDFVSAVGVALTEGASIFGTLAGTKSDFQDVILSIARIDTITLTGSSGSANILCDGVTKLIEITETNELTTLWHKGPTGTEDKPLLHLIGDELAEKYSTPQQFLSLPIIEKGVNSVNPLIKVVGNFQDPLNKIGGYNKIFAINGGVFDVKNREWEVDMNEILMFRQPAYVYENTTENFDYTGSVSITIGSSTMAYDFTFTDFEAGLRFTLEVYENGVFKNYIDLDTGADPFHVTGNISVSVCPYNMIYTLKLSGQ